MSAPDDTLPADIGLRQLRTKVHGRLFGSDVEPVRIGRYEVSEYLGSGGMGVVYAARDPELDRPVAIKLLRSDGLKETARTRLRREAKALAKLSHPNVVHVYEVGEDDGQVFVAMEYVEGATLAQWMEDEHSVETVLEMFIAVGLGLAAAHEAGFVHRDFKPDNVLIDNRGRPRVVDFGLVLSADDHTTTRPDPALEGGEAEAPLSLTKTGTLVGTPAYMAPEQHRGETADARADLFAYCVALHEALYGIRPFRGDSYEDLAGAVLRGDLVPPPPNKPVPKRVREAVARGLAVKPNDRFASLPELIDALTRKRRTRVHPAFWGAGAVAVVGAFTMGALMRGNDEAVPAFDGAREQCEAMPARVEAAWGDAARERVRAAFLATGQAFADRAFAQVDANLSAWSAQWASAWGQACENVATDFEDRLEQRNCLELRMVELDQLTDVFAEADARVVTQAPDASAALKDVELCLTEREGAPAADERSRDVERQLARTASLLAGGRRPQAHALAQKTIAAAAELSRPDLEARAHLHSIRSADPETDLKARMEALQTVAMLAREGGDMRTEAEAWIEMVALVTDNGDASPLRDAALGWADTAQWLLDRAPAPRLQIALHYHLAELYREQDAFDSARERLALAGESPRLNTARGRVEASAGDRSKAASFYRKAVAALEKTKGRGHPDTAKVRYELATVTENQAEALTLAREAYAAGIANQKIAAENVKVAVDAVGLMRKIASMECKSEEDCELFDEGDLEQLLTRAGEDRKSAKRIATQTRRLVRRKLKRGGNESASVIILGEGLEVQLTNEDAELTVDTNKVDWPFCKKGKRCRYSRPPKPPKPPKPPTRE